MKIKIDILYIISITLFAFFSNTRKYPSHSTMGLKIAIIEDEYELAENISDYLNKIGHEVVEILSSKKDFEETKVNKNTDIFLVDILLKGKPEGIELAQLIHEKFPKSAIIYTTALSSDSILNGISQTIYDSYLQKPYSLKALASSIFLVATKFQKNAETGIISNRRNLLSIKENGNTKILDENEVLYVKSDGLYSIVSSENSEYKVRELLKDFFHKLDSNDFYRVHKSFIINIRKITSINYRNCTVGKETIPLKRGIYKELLSKINKMPLRNEG